MEYNHHSGAVGEGRERNQQGRVGTVHIGLVIPGARELRYLYTNSHQSSGEDAGRGG